MSKKKVFIVDDDDIHLTTAELYLKSHYETYTMRSGNEVLEHLTTNDIIPDLILLDIIMPNMDGWEVFKKIQELGHVKHVPVIFLTSLEDEQKAKQAFKIGIKDYITKPINMAEIQKRIKNILGQ